MSYIKKLVMHGFKSFAQKTEIPFSQEINVVVGANGSGKSNIADAICFVLGRLSIKSIRAEKASHLIFHGTKAIKPSHEASVELIFDNSDKSFNLPSDEVSIKRIVRQNGQSIYKLNHETKTRQEILEVLASSGIDPYGFNIILQGEIQNFVRMKSDERRKIIEEIADISIYESRKEKSLHEFEKTEENLKEISAILRERTTFLKNLEEERKQALRYKKLEEASQRCKASILTNSIKEKAKEIDKINLEIEKKQKEADKIKQQLQKLSLEHETISERINQISSIVQKTSGIEQETLNREISDLKAELAGLTVRKENFETRLEESKKRIFQLKKQIPEQEKELAELRKKSPALAKKHQEIERRKKELEALEEKRKNYFFLRNQIDSLKERIREKKQDIFSIHENSELILREIEKLEENFLDKDYPREIEKINKHISELEMQISEMSKKEISIQRELAKFEAELEKNERLKRDIAKLDVCPLCKSKITEQHISHVISESESKISHFTEEIKKSNEELKNLLTNREELRKKIEISQREIEKSQGFSINSIRINEKKLKLKEIVTAEDNAKKELELFENKRQNSERELKEIEGIETLYDKKKLEIEEISARTEENLDFEIESKQRELEKTKLIIKDTERQEVEAEREISELEKEITDKENLLDKKLEKEQEMKKKFQKLFDERNYLQTELRKKETETFEVENNLRGVESEINEQKISKARISAEKENLEVDFSPYQGVQLIPASTESLKTKLENVQLILAKIGSVNLRALEVYDSVKAEYEKIAEKVTKLEQEKLEIFKIIEEIDKKKRKTFLKTLDSINELFSKNYIQLSTKGQAFLDLENKENIFEGGLDILIKLGKGKYMDVSSLSGGEQTLVALSLIFAIQEYKPYSFYILDEIDAALDKRNSERLAELLKKYMKSGQYVIITHNDALISESDIIYGVSMNQGVSKIISLQV